MKLPSPFCKVPILSVQGKGALCFGVWLGDKDGDWCLRLREFVAPAEWAHAQSFAQKIDADRHVAGRALVRSIVAEQYSDFDVFQEFSLNKWGKPYLEGRDLKFNISHAGQMVWCVCCSGVEVGIDVEYDSGEFEIQELLRFLHPEERKAIANEAGDKIRQSFFRCWVRKEAVSKANGQGVAHQLTEFQVSTDQGMADWLCPVGNSASLPWTTQDIIVPNSYSCSVVVASKDVPISSFALNF